MLDYMFAAKMNEKYYGYMREDKSKFLSIIHPSEWKYKNYNLKWLGVFEIDSKRDVISIRPDDNSMDST